MTRVEVVERAGKLAASGHAPEAALEFELDLKKFLSLPPFGRCFQGKMRPGPFLKDFQPWPNNPVSRSPKPVPRR